MTAFSFFRTGAPWVAAGGGSGRLSALTHIYLGIIMRGMMRCDDDELMMLCGLLVPAWYDTI